MLESRGIGAVARYTCVDFLFYHDSNAFVYVVCAVASDFCAFALTESAFFHDFQLSGRIVVVGFYVGKAVDTADNIGGVFAQAVKDNA